MVQRVIDPNNLKKGAELEIHELAGARGLDSARFRVQDVFPGGMGVVLQLQHLDTKELFALKVIRQEFLGKETTWGRFIEELKWWLTLSACEGVAEAYCIARVNEVPCMCAAWLHHGNLRQFIGRSKPKFIFKTMIRIIRTLEWAHAKHKVIHRDLKPENILLDQDWHAFVSDWGLVKPLNSFFEESKRSSSDTTNLSPQLTQTGQGVGTLLYAAPEQILGLQTVDLRADIYSLGCMLFEWETGRPPFLGSSQTEIAQKQLQMPPPKLEGNTILGLENVITRCLEKDLAKRFEAYDSLAKAILAVAAQKGICVEDYQPSERYHREKPGSDELQNRLKELDYSEKGISTIPTHEINALLDQFAAESALGNYKKGASMLAPFYIADMCRKLRDWTYCHGIAVNYGLSLSMAHPDQTEAIEVFESLSDAEPKTPEYFVNFSLTLHRNNEHSKAETIARAGLRKHPNDRDLLGNLTNALRFQMEHSQALRSAKRRLDLGRDIHALEEVGALLKEIGDSQEENWPEATKYYKSAVRYLKEAKALNPRYLPARVSLVMALRKLYRFGDASEECEALKGFAENRSPVETSVCLSAELLDDTKSYRECIDFCEEWIPILTFDINKSWLERTKAHVLVDHFMIGKEQDGKRVIIDEAVQFFHKRATDTLTASAEDLLYWARINEWMGHPNISFELLEVILDKKPEWWEPLTYKAQLLSRQGDSEKSLEAAKVAVKLAPYRPEPLDQLAVLYNSAGLHQEEEATKEKANEIFELRKSLCQ